MEKNVCIVNFNTTELTTAAIQSLWKNTPDCKVTVFDNSDRIPFGKMKGVRVIDNTKSQVIDFNKFLDEYPYKEQNQNNWGSDKHTYTIDHLFDLFPEGFVLMDSDVLVRKDISDLFDESVVWCGEERSYDNHNKPRLLPFLCWINVPMCTQYGIRYFDTKRNFRLDAQRARSVLYDTGAVILEDCKKTNLPVKEINLKDYIVHFGKGSWAKQSSYKQWLKKYNYLYQDKPMQTEEKYLVVIPYFLSGAQGREIEYAVAGWRKHFMEPYQIVIVGDHVPVCDSGDDITFIPCERVPEQEEHNYRPHIDFVNKFKKVRAVFPDSKGFIYGSDDCYAVNNFDIVDIKLIKQNGPDITINNYPPTKWEKEKKKTKDLLRKEGYPTRNFVTHLPLWIEWDKLEELWNRYDMEHNSYIFEDLYFNIFFSDRIPAQLHVDHDNFKCGVYRSNPRISYIEKAFKDKIWIQNSVEGWIPELDKMLSDYYGIK